MTANLSNPTPTRICRWLDCHVETLLRNGCPARLFVIDKVYYVEAVRCQESGQVCGWTMTAIERDGTAGECYPVSLSQNLPADCRCSCKGAQYGKGRECRHTAALRAALAKIEFVL